MLLIVGLGNPDPKYRLNRHNAGFLAVNALARAHGFGPWRAKFGALVADGFIDTDAGRVKTLLMKPQTYYNESGRAVQAAAKFYKIPLKDIVVFHDELDLAPGKFRVKTGGGAAGNNGIKSITAALGPDFRRARIGIGHPGDKALVTHYVLHDFAKEDAGWLDPLLDAITDAAPLLAGGKDDAFQTAVNHKAPTPK
ncbi:MAG: aminoacyl-tRNA hydrolase [Robiginitomaculum sp.]|nr:aminoacyl-tRNA hydrolase [Robiginitomaculum sp.]MDQ7076331.1 aminoacyl-tRNA hydrolase [Robiginitomaculum sp.]